MMVQAQSVQDWQIHTKQQLRSWKELARNAMTTTASIGIAIGGAAVTAAGAASALGQGIVQGAKSALQASQT